MRRLFLVGLGLIFFAVIVGVSAVTKTAAAPRLKNTCVRFQEVPQFKKFVYFVPNVTVSAEAAEGICSVIGGSLLTLRSVEEFEVISKLSDKYGRSRGQAFYWIDFDTTSLKMERIYHCFYMSYKDGEVYWGNGDCSQGQLLVACEIGK